MAVGIGHRGAQQGRRIIGVLGCGAIRGGGLGNEAVQLVSDFHTLPRPSVSVVVPGMYCRVWVSANTVALTAQLLGLLEIDTADFPAPSTVETGSRLL